MLRLSPFDPPPHLCAGDLCVEESCLHPLSQHKNRSAPTPRQTPHHSIRTQCSQMSIYCENVFSLKPNVSIEDAETPAGRVWISFLRLILGVDGCETAYWGRVAHTDDVRVIFVFSNQLVLNHLYFSGFNFGIKSMSGYSTRPYTYQVLQQPSSSDLASMRKTDLLDLPTPRERPERATVGTLFGVTAPPEILQSRREAVEGKEPLQYPMGDIMRFYDPWSAVHSPRTESGMPIDSFLFALKPHMGSVLEVPESLLGSAWLLLRKELSKTRGFAKLYWGFQEQYTDNVQVIILWHTTRDQEDFNGSGRRTEIWDGMLPFLAPAAGSFQIWSIKTPLENFRLLHEPAWSTGVLGSSARVLEILAFYLPESITETDRQAFEYYFAEFSGAFRGWIRVAGEEDPQHISLGGWVDGLVPLGTAAANVYVAFCSWKNPRLEMQKCNRFTRPGNMATEMVEAMAMLGVESRHVLISNLDTEESLHLPPTRPGPNPFGNFFRP